METNLETSLDKYIIHLALEEKNHYTVKQYQRDIGKFLSWIAEQKASKERKEPEKALQEDKPISQQAETAEGMKQKTEQPGKLTTEDLTKKIVIAYKDNLQKEYKATTTNCKLAALNGFFTFLDRTDLKVKQLKIQRQSFCPKEKELTQAEYDRLVQAAKDMGNEKLSLILQTICSTGIRVSELQFITVEMVENGETSIQLKGKTRPLMLPRKLRRLLKEYIKKNNITSGPVFVTRTGKALDRSSIWRMMKSLCEKARVNPAKVHPHALRHLFARVFYSSTKDIVKLADILGHSSINTTRIYVISTGEEHQKLLDELKLVS